MVLLPLECIGWSLVCFKICLHSSIFAIEELRLALVAPMTLKPPQHSPPRCSVEFKRRACEYQEAFSGLSLACDRAQTHCSNFVFASLLAQSRLGAKHRRRLYHNSLCIELAGSQLLSTGCLICCNCSFHYLLWNLLLHWIFLERILPSICTLSRSRESRHNVSFPLSLILKRCFTNGDVPLLVVAGRGLRATGYSYLLISILVRH